MGDEQIWESAQQTLIGMEIGRNLNFDVISRCKKAERKLEYCLAVLVRLSQFTSFKQKQILMKTFF